MKLNELSIEKDELHVFNDHATIYEVKELDHSNENMLRVWCTQQPDSYTFQIRTHKAINNAWGTGKKRNMIANISIDIKTMEEILKFMKREV